MKWNSGKGEESVSKRGYSNWKCHILPLDSHDRNIKRGESRSVWSWRQRLGLWAERGEVRDCGIYGLCIRRIRTTWRSATLSFFGAIMWHKTQSPKNAENNVTDVTHPNICVMKCLSASSLSRNDVQEAGKKKRLLNDWFWEKCGKNREMSWMKKLERWKERRDRKCNEKKGAEWQNRASKNKIRSLFTHPHVIANLYGFLSFVEHKRKDFDCCFLCNYNKLGAKLSSLKGIQKPHKIT